MEQKFAHAKPGSDSASIGRVAISDTSVGEYKQLLGGFGIHLEEECARSQAEALIRLYQAVFVPQITHISDPYPGAG